MQGKPLYPHTSFRNVTVQVNWGSAPLTALPFTCKMLQGAARSDLTPVRSSKPKDGKYEVVVPVAFPDEGTFDWLDDFLAANPSYTELSDRAIISWAEKSGLRRGSGGDWRRGGGKGDDNSSNDKPSFNFGVPLIDDSISTRTIISTVARLVPRNYVVMEVKGNLISD